MTQQVDCWESINVTINPELKAPLLLGDLVTFTCAGCGSSARLNYNLLYHDMERRIAIWLRYPDETGSILIEKIARDAFEYIGASLSIPYVRRTVTSFESLREKILLLDDGYDDREIEFLKYMSGAEEVGGLWYVETQRSLLGRRRLRFLVPNVRGVESVMSTWSDLKKARHLWESARSRSNHRSEEDWSIVDQKYVRTLLGYGIQSRLIEMIKKTQRKH